MTKMYRPAAAMLLSLLGALPLFGAGAKDSITLALIPGGLSLAQKMPLQKYLTEQMGRNVKLMTPASYTDTLEGLSDGSIDFALLGALTYVRACPREVRGRAPGPTAERSVALCRSLGPGLKTQSHWR